MNHPIRLCLLTITIALVAMPFTSLADTTTNDSTVVELSTILAERTLPTGDRFATWTAFYNKLFALDADADEAWEQIKNVQEFDLKRKELRAKMIERIGGLPEKTPLNAKVVGTVQRKGYSIEKILFESRPGMFVTGNLYLPDQSRFPAPYPAAIELCGHSRAGKNSPKYQRVGVLCAKNGVAVFVVDPLGQGERSQSLEEESKEGSPVRNHIRMGVNALLLGLGLAAAETWDAIRALDYLDTRTDLRKDGYGACGNSGGGTQSIMLAALDDRIKFTATSCYLSNFREQTMWRLLADCEQLIFAQLADGFNHAAYPFLNGNPVSLLARRDDMIPYSGTLATVRLLQKVGKNLGLEGWYGFVDSPGPHGYDEKLMRTTAVLMAKHLRGAKALFDEPEFDETKQDFGPDAKELFIVPDGRVQTLPGFKSFYSYLHDKLDAAISARAKLSLKLRATLVRKIADIDENRVGEKKIVSESQLADGTLITRVVYDISDGYRMPVIELIPQGAERYQPLILAIDGSRTNCAELVRANKKRAIFIPDLCACGDIGAARHYYVNKHDDEETAKMLYLMGSSLVGRRAGELIALGKEARRRFGKNPTLITTGRLAVPAAHAIAAEPELFTCHDFINPPRPWEVSVRNREMSLYSTSVHGALRYYDWIDLSN